MLYSIQSQPMASATSCTTDFGAYLHISKDQQFVLDLSQASLLDILDEQIKLKQKLSPKFGKSLSCLIRHLKIIEKQYACTLMPVQITDIFWVHFTHYLQCAGLAIPSIKTLCSQLKSAPRLQAS